jgi:hypothetical protein
MAISLSHELEQSLEQSLLQLVVDATAETDDGLTAAGPNKQRAIFSPLNE